MENEKSAEEAILQAKLEQRVDSLEELIANLVLAYSEIWVAIENLTNTVLSTKTPEEQAQFSQDFLSFRTEMIKHIKDASGGVGAENPDLTSSLEDLVRGFQTPPTS